jgi:hypothetical protein
MAFDPRDDRRNIVGSGGPEGTRIAPPNRWQLEAMRRHAEEANRRAAEAQRQAAERAAAERAAAQQAAAQQAAEQAAAEQAAAQQATVEQTLREQAAAQQAADQERLAQIEAQRLADAQAAEAQRQQAAQQPAAVQALNRPAQQLANYRGYTPMEYDASRTGALTDWYARMLNVPVAQPFMAQSRIQGPDPDRSIFGLSSLLEPVTLKKGGRVRMQEGGSLPNLSSFVPSNWADVYSFSGGMPRPELYGQTTDERMSTARDFFSGLSPEIQQAAIETTFKPQDFGMNIAGNQATHDISAYNRAIADKMGVLGGLLGDTEYGDISGVLQDYARYTGTPPPQFGGQGGANEERYRQWMGKKQAASDKLAYLLDQQRLAGQQAAEEAAQQQQQQEEQAAADAATQQQQQQAAAQQVLDDATLQNIQQQRIQDAQDAATMQTAAAAQPAAEQALNRPAPQLPQYRGYTPMQYDASRTGALTDWYARMLNVPVAQPFMAQSQIQGPDPDRSIFGLSSMLDPVTFRKGGRVGKMHGGMMIVDDNNVVNDGIGAILSKYKEIRSEL